MFKTARILAVLICLGWLSAAGAKAADVKVSFTEGNNLPEGWMKDIAGGSDGSASITPKGLAISSAKGYYVLAKMRNERVGTDAQPLRVSVSIESDRGYQLSPSLIVFWDKDNWLQFKYTTDKHLYVRWSHEGRIGERGFWNVTRDYREGGAYVRFVLTSQNVFLFCGHDGTHWRDLGALGFRPGPANTAPKRIMLGRGWEGDYNNKDRADEFANNYNPNKGKGPTSTFRDFVLSDTPDSLPEELPEMERAENWDGMIRVIQSLGIPRSWLMLGPRPDKNFRLFDSKEGLEPDHSDNWDTIPKDERGQPFRTTKWDRPEEELQECYVDMAEILDPDSLVLAYARTTLDWPLEAPAMLWCDGNGPIVVSVNGQEVFDLNKADRNNRRYSARRDKWAVPVSMKKGENVIRVKTGQHSGPWGYYLRVERNDPGYRIRLLERLRSLYPEDAKAWRGAEALLEIPRRYEEMFDFAAAQKAYDVALKELAADDEFRQLALNGKLGLLESLRDWKGLAATAEAYLKEYGGRAGTESALRASLLAELSLGQEAKAQARVKKWLGEFAGDADRIEYLLRAMAGAARTAGKDALFASSMMQLVDHPDVGAYERGRAGLEAAFVRMGAQIQPARENKSNPAELKACAEMAIKALKVLPSAKRPQVAYYLAEAEKELRANQGERALMTAWAAATHALLESYAGADHAAALSKAYPVPNFTLDDKKSEKERFDEAKKQGYASLSEHLDGVKWLDEWYAAGPFDNKGGEGEQTDFGPEKAVDMNAAYDGRGGKKKWVKLESGKHGHDYGQKIDGFLGNCKEGLAYLTREFEVTSPGKKTLFLSLRGGWYAWIDGKPVGQNPDAVYGMDRDKVEVDLPQGKHRLLLKLICPEDGTLTYQVRISPEPTFAAHLLVKTWQLRAAPYLKLYNDYWEELWWLLRYSNRKVYSSVLYAQGETLSTLFAADAGKRWEGAWHGFYYVAEYRNHSLAARAFGDFSRRLETTADYSGRDGHLWNSAERYFLALRAEGETLRADQVMLRALAQYRLSGDATSKALVYRGTLREDFALSRESRRFFQRAVSEYPWYHTVTHFGVRGLSYAKSHKPERMIFETQHNIQASIEAAQRQMNVGEKDDVRRAMRNLGEVIRTGSDSLIRLSDSRFNPMYVGVREYIRALLVSLGGDTIQVYRETVDRASQQRLSEAMLTGVPGDLEALAGVYYDTPAAAIALNQAGNLYLDRGAFSQAVSVFRILLDDYKEFESSPPVLVAAKLGRALLLDGQFEDAKRAARDLASKYGQQTLTVAGRRISGEEYSKTLLAQIGEAEAHPEMYQNRQITGTLNSGPRRTGLGTTGPAPEPGPVVWARTRLPSESEDLSSGTFFPDPYLHVSSHPVVAEGRVFVSSYESIQALDARDGRELWTQAWGSAGRLLNSGFVGHPISCPTVDEGRVYLRVLRGARSALECYDAETGSLRWSTDSLPELRRTVWLSDPLIVYGLAIGIYLQPGDLNTHGVAALDLETGRFRWKQDLVTGSTGLKYNYQFYGTSLQLGPPAADGGVIYAQTGMCSLAALNAFTGEVIWLSGYPRMSVANFDRGNSGIGDDFRQRMLKLIARGPSSPVVTPDVILVAPKDASGLIAFDRRSGSIRWQEELSDARYLVGVCNGHVLTVDNSVRAVDASTGLLAWERPLGGRDLFGRPGFSGGVLYLPMENALLRVDARNGRLLSSDDWDERVGPAVNLVVTGDRIIGVNERDIVALGKKGAKRAELPLAEARMLLDEGKIAEASARFARALASDHEHVLEALSGRIQTMQKLGQNEEALAEIQRVLGNQPEKLRSAGGLWEVSKKVFAQGMAQRLGQPAPPPAEIKSDPKGMWSFAWQLEGSDPKMYFPENLPKDRFFVMADNYLFQLRLSTRLEILWKTYVGPDVRSVKFGEDVLVVAGRLRLHLVDVHTGQTTGQIGLPTDQSRRNRRAGADGFNNVALGKDKLAAYAGYGLFVYDLATAKELWSNESRDRNCEGLAFAGDKLVEIRNQRRKESTFHVYDVHTGRRVLTRKITGNTDGKGAWPSDDGKVFVYRSSHTQLMGVDMETGKKLWDRNFPHLDRESVRYADGVFHFSGDSRRRDPKGWHHWYINPLDGKDVRPVIRGADMPIGEEYIDFRDHHARQIFRLKDNPQTKKRDEVWKTQIPDDLAANHHRRTAFLTGDTLQIFYVWQTWNSTPKFVLRSFDWETGQMLGQQILPGYASKDREGSYEVDVLRRGPLLLIGCAHGLFAYATLGETREQIAEQYRKVVETGKAEPAEHVNARRGLAPIEPVTMQAFLAPDDQQVDGDLSEWGAMEPLALDTVADYTPLGDHLDWRGKEDLSARIYTGWDKDAVYVAVDVSDDVFAPALPGADLASGDSLRIVLNSDSEPRYGFDLRENMVCSMALVDDRTVINLHGDEPEEQDHWPKGRVIRSPDGRGLRYELRLPWPLLRDEAAKRPGRHKNLYVGVAVFDNDGKGTRGAMEWGAAVNSAHHSPVRMGRLALLDISTEKIQRYRKVIAMVPDAPESIRFLELILTSKRGVKAHQERREELEAFIKKQPAGAHAVRALSHLVDEYKSLKIPNPLDEVVKFAKASKCPSQVIDDLAGKVFKIWVYIEPKGDTRMLMIQFKTARHSWSRRAYWGESRVNWGRERSHERMRFGKMPAEGQWHELVIRASELNMEDEEITGFACTTFGGQVFWDRASVTVDGKETVLVDDAVPNGMRVEGNKLSFVGNQKKSGGQSWTAGATKGLMNSHFEGANTWFSFKNAQPLEPPKIESAELQKRYREAGSMLADSSEGFTFLRRVIGLYGGNDALAKSISECEDYLRKHRDTVNALPILDLLQDYYQKTGERNTVRRCQSLMQEFKLSRDIRRAFYRKYVHGWDQWHLIGPFEAVGDRNGLDNDMDPERGVDLSWKPKGAFEIELAWKEFINKKEESYVNVQEHLFGPLDKEQRRDLERAPWFAYAYKKFNVPKERRATLYFGCTDLVSIWVNGERVVNIRRPGNEKDANVQAVELANGDNEILVKVGVRGGRMGFWLRVANENGQPYDDLIKR